MGRKLSQTKKRFYTTLGIVVLMVLFLAIMDIVAVNTLFIGNAEKFLVPWYHLDLSGYFIMFWAFAAMIGIIICLLYYMFRKDKSEVFALALSYIILIITGLEDMFFYLFQGKWLDPVMVWLDKNIIMKFIATIMGEVHVTDMVLVVSVVAGIILSGIVVILLRKK